MDLTPYITNLREDLAATAAAGDDRTRQAAALLSGALEPAARLTLMNALADLAAEVTASLPGQVVEVRLEGRDVRVVVTGSPEEAHGSHEQPLPPRPAPPPEPAPPESPVDTGDISRITLRLFEHVKGQAEQAAAAQGISLNSFVAQAVQGALRGKGWQHRYEFGERGRTDRRQGGESRLHGWVEG